MKDANDAPVSVALSGNAVSENATAGTVVGKLSTGDEDRSDSHTYTLVDTEGNEVKDVNFEILDNAIVVRDGHTLNYESSISQTLYVKSTDSAGASYVQAVTLNVRDSNDAPFSVELSDKSVSEAASAGTVVGTLSTRDEDRNDSHTYTLVDAQGNEVRNANFEIRDNAIVVRDGHSLNYESSTSQTLYVKAIDSTGASYIQAVTLNVRDANDAPVSVALSGNAVSEDATAGAVVGTLSTRDEDPIDSHNYTIVDAQGNEVRDANFEIRDNAIVVRDGHSLNYESSTSQTLYVKSTDSSGASHVEAVTVNVKDANDAPISVRETLTTNEDQSVSVQFHRIDEDSEEQSEQYRIESLPSHGQLLLNGMAVNTGDVISSLDQSSGRLQFVPDRNWHGEDRISFRAFDGHQWSNTSADIQIVVAPVADVASLVVEPATGLAGGTISLQISAGLPDSDSGEQLKIYIGGVPEGVILNAGERQIDGTWILEPEDLTALTMTLSPLPPAQFSLTVTVVSSEANGSTASTTTELDVTVLPENEGQPDSQSGPEAAVPFSAVPEQPRHSLAPATILPSTELPPVRIISQSPSAVETIGSGVIPLGYTFVLPVTETPDWSNTIFGEVSPMMLLDSSELTPDTASSEGAATMSESYVPQVQKRVSLQRRRTRYSGSGVQHELSAASERKERVDSPLAAISDPKEKNTCCYRSNTHVSLLPPP